MSGCKIEAADLGWGHDGVRRGAFDAIVLIAERPVPSLEVTLDDICARTGTVWTSAVVLAQQFRIGPTVIPGQTPCHECWSRRLRSKMSDPRLHDAIMSAGQQLEPERWFQGRLPALDDQVAALAAAETPAVVTGSYDAPPNQMGRFWLGNAIYGYLEAHHFAGIGVCTRCAPANVGDELATFVSERFTAV